MFISEVENCSKMKLFLLDCEGTCLILFMNGPKIGKSESEKHEQSGCSDLNDMNQSLRSLHQIK